MNPIHLMEIPALLFYRVLAQGPSLTGTPSPQATSDVVTEFGPSSVDFTVLFLKMIFAMIFVIALALVLIRYVLPRLAIGRTRGRTTDIRVVDRIPLDARKSLCLLEVEGKRFLIGVSENYIGMVAELRPNDETPQSKN